MTDSVNFLWVLASAALVMCMQIGFCMLEAGLVRSKNSINVAIKNLCDFCVAAILFWVSGFALMFGNSPTGWVGISDFFLESVTAPSALVFFIFQLMFCATSATIVSGAVAERMSFASYLIVTAVVSGLLYPIAGGWAWNQNGWLHQLGFRDFAGSTVVHGVGGWVALASVIILGPRIGRFDIKHSLASSHSLVISTIGVLVLFVSWFGFNGGSTFALTDAVPGILLNTVLGGAAGFIGALVSVWPHKKLPELPPALNGCVGGLVAITAGCQAMSPASALLVGFIGGVLSYLAVLALEALRIDDVVGASAAHGVPGVWGTLAVAIFGNLEVLDTGLGRWEQLGIQLLGVSVFFAWAFGVGWAVLFAINKLHPLRVDADLELVGLNVSEHGASTEIIDLLNEMAHHSYKGEFTERVSFEPFTEVGQIATQYNRVIDKVVAEMEMRESIARHLQRARDESENANRKIFSSLQYARRIQHAILPSPRQLQETLGDHFVLYEPRDIVSGDFYWCATVGTKRFCAVVDCTGHGVPGAFMSMIGYLLLEHTIVEEQMLEPAEILSAIHQRVRQALGQNSDEGAGNRDGMEMALIRIDRDEVIFAGANRPLWWFIPTMGEPEFGEIGGDHHGIGGGALEPEMIEFTQHRIPRHPQLALYLQTDGLLQQPNHLRAIYDRRRLRELLSSLQTTPISQQARHVSASLQNFRGGAKQRDDITLIGLQPFSLPEPEVPPSAVNGTEYGDELFRLEGPMTSRAIADAGRILRERTNLTMQSRLALFGLFVEMAQNIARHSAERADGVGVGTIFARIEENYIAIGASNLVNAARAEALRAEFDRLRALDPAQLRALYMERLHQGTSEAGSSGLGLIDLSRKSKIFPEISLKERGPDKFLFSMTVRVPHN